MWDAEPTPTHRYVNGMDVRKFTMQSDSDGTGQYMDYFRAALGHEHSIESIKNGISYLVHRSTKDGPLPKFVDDGASAVLRTARHQIERTNAPYISFLNLMDAHLPLQHIWRFDKSIHNAPNAWSSEKQGFWELVSNSTDQQSYWEIRRPVYGAAIEYLDRLVMEFVDWLTSESRRETTVVVTADHGENLGTKADEYLPNHSSSLSEGLLHVPCYLFNPPTGYDSNEDEYFSHLNLRELLVGLAQDKTPDVFNRRIAAELIGHGTGDIPDGFDENEWNRMIRCVYEGTQKTVWDSIDQCQLFELDRERPCWQRKNSESVTIPDWATTFFDVSLKEYKEHAMRDEDEKQISPETATRLEELGYL
jgi:hypothetical protein